MNWRKRKSEFCICRKSKAKTNKILDKLQKKDYNFDVEQSMHNKLCGNNLKFGGVAQLGERTVRIRKVESSILFVSTKNHRNSIRNYGGFLFVFGFIRSRRTDCYKGHSRSRAFRAELHVYPVR